MRLIKELLYKNIIKVVSIFLVLILVCTYIGLVIARYNYYKNYYDMFNKPEFSNASFVDIGDYVRYGYDSLEEQARTMQKIPQHYVFDKARRRYFKDNDIYSDLKKLSAVDNVYYYYGVPANYARNWENRQSSVFAMSNDTYKLLFQRPLSSGKNFEDTEQTSKYPNAVVCGPIYDDVSVGDDIPITAEYIPVSEFSSVSYYQASSSQIISKEYKVHVIGKISYPYKTLNQLPPYQRQLNYDLFNTNDNAIIMLDNDFTLNYFSDISVKSYPGESIVSYKKGASAKDMEEFRAYCDKMTSGHIDKLYKKFDIKRHGGLPRIYVNGKDVVARPYNNSVSESYDYAINNLNSETKARLLPVALVIGAIGIIASCFAAVLMVRKKRKDICIYYFCGCTKSKVYLLYLSITAASVLAVGILSSVFMYVYNNISFFFNSGDNSEIFTILGSILHVDFNMSFIDFQSNCYIAVWLYLLVVFVILSVLIYFLTAKRKYMLIDFYNKLKI